MYNSALGLLGIFFFYTYFLLIYKRRGPVCQTVWPVYINVYYNSRWFIHFIRRDVPVYYFFLYDFPPGTAGVSPTPDGNSYFFFWNIFSRSDHATVVVVVGSGKKKNVCRSPDKTFGYNSDIIATRSRVSPVPSAGDRHRRRRQRNRRDIIFLSLFIYFTCADGSECFFNFFFFCPPSPYARECSSARGGWKLVTSVLCFIIIIIITIHESVLLVLFRRTLRARPSAVVYIQRRRRLFTIITIIIVIYNGFECLLRAISPRRETKRIKINIFT